jgi:hypothetical protein
LARRGHETLERDGYSDDRHRADVHHVDGDQGCHEIRAAARAAHAEAYTVSPGRGGVRRLVTRCLTTSLEMTLFPQGELPHTGDQNDERGRDWPEPRQHDAQRKGNPTEQRPDREVSHANGRGQ